MTAEFVFPAGREWDDVLARLIRHIHGLDHAKAHVVKVERWRRERTDAQNRALWGLAYKVLHEATGNDPEDMHLYFCGEFFGWVEHEMFGRKRLKPRRTTTRDEHGRRDVISTKTLAEFFAFIQQRAAETVGVYIPDPDPEYWRQDAA